MLSYFKKARNLFLRKIIFRKHEIGPNFHAGRQVYLYAKNKIKIGKNFYIGRYSEIGCDAEIGDNVIIANSVAFIGKYDHHYQMVGTPIRLAPQIRHEDYNWKGLDSKVIIEDDVWIGYGCKILSGVTIGAGSIIAAGSLVTKNVEAISIYGGVPAKKISPRFECESDGLEHLALINNS
ncbi:hypothetical protein N9Z14_04445 [Opitutales bacterium]|nr:hypothetical protein [Opitutales bacterium]